MKLFGWESTLYSIISCRTCSSNCKAISVHSPKWVWCHLGNNLSWFCTMRKGFCIATLPQSPDRICEIVVTCRVWPSVTRYSNSFFNIAVSLLAASLISFVLVLDNTSGTSGSWWCRYGDPFSLIVDDGLQGVPWCT